MSEPSLRDFFCPLTKAEQLWFEVAMDWDALIHNAVIVTVNPDFDIIENGFIAVKDGRIAEIGPWPAGDSPLPRVKNRINANGGILLPGMVNTHGHLPMTLFRGMADDLPLMTWLQDHIFPAEARHVTPETVFHGTLLACAEMILSGTTTCCCGYFHEDNVAAAAATTGMRAVLGQGIIDFPAPGVPDPSENVAHALAFAEKWRERFPLIAPSIFCHSPYTCSADTLMQAKASSGDLMFQIHGAETESEYRQIWEEQGCSPIAYLNHLGILDSRTLVVHGVWTHPDDMAILCQSGASISHCPHSNMKLASGVAPAAAMVRAGLRVGLGTDGCASGNTLDMFRTLDMTARLHKVVAADPTVMDASTVLRMATIGGAEAIGLGQDIGSLEKGKSADLVILDPGGPHLAPMSNPVSHLVYAASGADVRDVMVAGRWLLRDRRLQTIDWPAVRNAVQEIAAAISDNH